MDERRYRRPVWMWLGSVLIALLVVGGLVLGTYRLYAFGFAQGAASLGREPADEATEPTWAPVPGFVPYRAGRFPVLGLVLGLFLIGALVRHTAWGRHRPWMGRRATGPWHRHGCYDGRAWYGPGYAAGRSARDEAEVSE